jgi:excisionase family DNA binding protein
MSRESDTSPPSGGTSALMTVSEAASYLSVPTRWLSEAVRQRRVRCTRLGRHIRFRREHLDEFIEANEQPVTTRPAARTALRPVQAAGPGSPRSRL